VELIIVCLFSLTTTLFAQVFRSEIQSSVMGASVSISPPLNMQTVNIKNFLSDKTNLHALFCSIVTYSRPNVRKDRRGMKDRLAIEEILLYFTKDASTFITNNFVCNSLVIIAAFEFALNKKVRTVRSKIDEKQFLRFMEAMFLFSHLWEMYLVSDDHVQDEILFIGEFIRCKHKLAKIKGFYFKKEISDEDWAAAFKDIDKSSDKEVSFAEVCHYYVIKHLISPKKYAALAISHPKDIKHTLSDRRNMRIFSTRRENTKRLIDMVRQLSFKVDGNVFAVDLPTAPSSRGLELTRQSSLKSSVNNSMASLRSMILQMHDDDDSQVIQEDCGDDTTAGNNEASALGNEENVASRLSLFRTIKQKKQALQQEPNSSMANMMTTTTATNSDTDYDRREGPCQQQQEEHKHKHKQQEEHKGEVPATNTMDFYFAVNAAQAATDLANTRKRLALVRSSLFISETIPDHAVPTETQRKAAHLRTLHATTANKQINHTSAQKYNNKMKNTKQESFLSKFPDPTKINPHPCPLDYHQHDDDDDPDLKYMFVTENRTLFDNASTAQSDIDSNYIHVDTSNLSHYSDTAAEVSVSHGTEALPPHLSSLPNNSLPNNSLSIRVQSDFGGSIHTNSLGMQHLSFDRDTGRKPPHLGGDASIALGSVANDDDGHTVGDGMMLTDNMSLLDDAVPQGETMTDDIVESPQPTPALGNAFSPLDNYATHRKSSPHVGMKMDLDSRAEYTSAASSSSALARPCTMSRVESAPSTRGAHTTDSHFYKTTGHRPGSAPAHTHSINLSLAPQGCNQELEAKYYPPARELGYYVRRAKSSPKKKRPEVCGRSTYRVPNCLRGPAVPLTPPLCHSWMLDEEEGRLGGRGQTHGGDGDEGRMATMMRVEKVPLCAKKSQAIANIRRNKLNITR
jgi:hypothetical protein